MEEGHESRGWRVYHCLRVRGVRITNQARYRPKDDRMIVFTFTVYIHNDPFPIIVSVCLGRFCYIGILFMEA